MYYIVWDMFVAGLRIPFAPISLVKESAENIMSYRRVPGAIISLTAIVGRRHYDTTGGAWLKMAMNTLDKTDHEPMLRILCIEETWCKKYNLPDSVWDQRYEEPKDFQNYYRLRRVITPEGLIVQNYVPWLTRQRYLQNQR